MTTTPVPTPPPLPPDRLRRRCEPATLDFDPALPPAIVPATALIGQERAAEAIDFGLAMTDRGFNVFAAGPGGTGKTTAVRAFLARAAAARPAASDWCYVHNFREPDRPRALQLRSGEGRQLRDALRQIVQAARREIPRAFESEEYIARREAILGDLEQERQRGIGALTQRAASAATGSRPLSDEEVANLRPEMIEQISSRRQALEVEARTFFKSMRTAERAARDRLDAQDREVALLAVGGLVDDLLDDYPENPAVAAWLAEVREGILADVPLFRGHPLPADGTPPAPAAGDPDAVLRERSFRRYEVNVLVDHGEAAGAPVVVEFNPTYPNLFGRIEREALFGALVTDVTLIGAGALHRANGGYLVLRADDLFRAPLAWEALKRTLREGEIRIEDPGDMLGLTSARGLRPDPIPLDVKTVLLGDPTTYALLHAYDDDFRELFKVRADFAADTERTTASENAVAGFLAGCAVAHGATLTHDGAARMVEECSRMADDQRKLSLRLGALVDLLREAEHHARGEDGATPPAVTAAHVRRALDARRRRAGQLPERLQEMVARRLLLVRTDGAVTGQINGLAVIGYGDTAFGRPTRITATVGAGRDGVLDIERQADLGGRLHSKGVLIVGGYLTDRYAGERPLALSARLVFEQSYDEVEGDSASLAELLALLSRLAGAPLRQSLAITGSVNQRGEVQAIGGANEKVEGFFDVCRAAGFTGEQGVVLPEANVETLMLREDVAEAAAAGSFRVYSVRTVDEAFALLTGEEAAALHARVADRLRALSDALREQAPPATIVHETPPHGTEHPNIRLRRRRR